MKVRLGVTKSSTPQVRCNEPVGQTQAPHSAMLASPFPAPSSSLLLGNSGGSSVGKRRHCDVEEDIESSSQRARIARDSPQCFEFVIVSRRSASHGSRSHPEASTPRLAPQRGSSEVSFASPSFSQLQPPIPANPRSGYLEPATEDINLASGRGFFEAVQVAPPVEPLPEPDPESHAFRPEPMLHLNGAPRQRMCVLRDMRDKVAQDLRHRVPRRVEAGRLQSSTAKALLGPSLASRLVAPVSAALRRYCLAKRLFAEGQTFFSSPPPPRLSRGRCPQNLPRLRITAAAPTSGFRFNAGAMGSTAPATATKGRQLAPLTEGRGALGMFDKDVNLVVTTLANAIVRQTIGVEEVLQAKAKEDEAMREALRAALRDPTIMQAQPLNTACEGDVLDPVCDVRGEVVGSSTPLAASNPQDDEEATDQEDDPLHPSVSSSSFSFSSVKAATVTNPALESSKSMISAAVVSSTGRPTPGRPPWPTTAAGDLEASSAESPPMPLEGYDSPQMHLEGGGSSTAELDLASGSCAEPQAERSSNAALDASLAGVFASGVESVDWVSVVQDAYMLEPEELLRQQKTLKVAEMEPEEDSKADIGDDEAEREIAGWLLSDAVAAGSGGGHMQWDDITEDDDDDEEEDFMFVKRRRHSIWH